MRLPVISGVVERWDPFSVHNLLAHPLSEMLHLLGLEEWSTIVHDSTLPDHEPGTGRG